MGQINVNPGGNGDSAAAAGINLVTVLIVLAVIALLAFLAWQFLLATPGPAPAPDDTVPNPGEGVPPADNPPAPESPGGWLFAPALPAFA